MIVLGLNSEWDLARRVQLKPGGACLVVDGVPVCAILEERLTRVKHAAGYQQAARYCLQSAGVLPEEVDLCVVSNCFDYPPDEVDLERHARLLGIPRPKVLAAPSHHLVHAASAFYASPFDKALILVADDEGNMIGPRRYETEFWLNRFERVSLYVGHGTEIRLHRRFCDGWREIGIGTAWRFFTRWLGFGPWYNAGKTMGLAAYGDPHAFGKANLFTMTPRNRFRVLLENRPKDKASAIEKFFREQCGTEIGSARDPEGPLTEREKNVAAFLQRDTERILVNIVQQALAETGMRNVCFAGGVSLNCLAVRAVADRTTAERVFVQPSASDAGQCLGCALYGYYRRSGARERTWQQRHTFFGAAYPESDILSAMESHARDIVYRRLGATLPREAAHQIAQGRTVGWYQGGAELGPRALGNRSILADPRHPQTKQLLNEKVKHREMFRPFAPSILATRADEMFDCVAGSSFMAVVAHARPGVARLVPSAVHVDGTARVQVVDAEANPKLHELLTCFEQETKTPLVINTSFNLSGEPIVETPAETLECFLNTGLDVLCCGDYIVFKREEKAGPLAENWASGT